MSNGSYKCLKGGTLNYTSTQNKEWTMVMGLSLFRFHGAFGKSSLSFCLLFRRVKKRRITREKNFNKGFV